MRRLLAACAIAVMFGLLAASSSRAKPVVLFDEDHGQAFLAGRGGELDLSGLAAIFRETGMDVRTSRGPLDAAALSGISALVISGAFAPIRPDEVAAIREFVGRGGRLALMLHIGQPYSMLLAQLGIEVSNRAAREREGIIDGNSLDFSVTRLERHALTEGLENLSVFGCWTLRSTNPAATPIALTGPKTWFDRDRNEQFSPDELFGSQAVVIAGTLDKGEYLVFGGDAIFQNRFLQSYNRELGRRLGRWLAGAAGAEPHAPDQPRPKSTGL